MKKDIHPKYYDNTKVTCACGATFEVGSTVPELKLDICSNCHPAYTGKKKFIDTAGRLEKFMAKMEKGKKLRHELEVNKKPKTSPDGATKEKANGSSTKGPGTQKKS